MNYILRTYDLNPDGVKVEINWGAFVIGSSLFIPCINTVLAKRQLATYTRSKGWSTTAKTREESGLLGVRIWRTL